MVNSQQADDHEEDESDGSVAECSDNDSEAESSNDMHGDDHEEGLFSIIKSLREELKSIGFLKPGSSNVHVFS